MPTHHEVLVADDVRRQQQRSVVAEDLVVLERVELVGDDRHGALNTEGLVVDTRALLTERFSAPRRIGQVDDLHVLGTDRVLARLSSAGGDGDLRLGVLRIRDDDRVLVVLLALLGSTLPLPLILA